MRDVALEKHLGFPIYLMHPHDHANVRCAVCKSISLDQYSTVERSGDWVAVVRTCSSHYCRERAKPKASYLAWKLRQRRKREVMAIEFFSIA
jgi:hypothetical protein